MNDSERQLDNALEMGKRNHTDHSTTKRKERVYKNMNTTRKHKHSHLEPNMSPTDTWRRNDTSTDFISHMQTQPMTSFMLNSSLSQNNNNNNNYNWAGGGLSKVASEIPMNTPKFNTSLSAHETESSSGLKAEFCN